MHFSHPELLLRLPDADAGVVAVRADHGAHGAHAHRTLPAVDPVDLLVLLAPPQGNVLHGRNQGVVLEDGRLQVRTEVLLTHGRPTHQAGLHSRLVPRFRAVMTRDWAAV